MQNNENQFVSLTETELETINGGTGFFSTVGEYVGKALAYACENIIMINYLKSIEAKLNDVQYILLAVVTSFFIN